ncbi:MAG: ABC transporter substrate-binding protein [Sphingomonas sp.]|nr:ABC transporter substrate-binding protein [Sphingomonas sp.]
MRPFLLRRALCFALVVAAASLGSSCDRQAGGTLAVVVIGDSPTITDPSEAPIGIADALLLASTAQGLVRFDARGQVVPGLAETWNVSDDGLSYIFRLANTEWPDGRRVTAERVARLLRRHIAPGSENPIKDALGAVAEVVPMTDRVLEIRLNSPRPDLLQLLAHPQLTLVYQGQGAGPFALQREQALVRLTREVATPDEEQTRTEQLQLRSASAREAVAQFAAGTADLVIGGTFADLPYARAIELPRRALQFDPASGLFGLVPVRAEGLLATAEVRQLLSQAIDREALLAAFAVPGLAPRTTVLEPGLADLPDPAPQPWTAVPLAERQPALVATARQLLGPERRSIRIALPEGPGSELLLDRLRRDWGAIGLDVELAERRSRADLRLVDQVAPSNSPAWFLRSFRCGVAKVCDSQADELIEGARSTLVLAQRSALLLEASRQIDAAQLFIPLAAPVRWSLVSPRVSGFSGNRFALHTLTGLEERLSREE